MGLNVLITGAGGGIGHAVSIAYAKTATKLILCDFNKENLNKTKESCKKFLNNIDIYQFDLSKSEEIEDITEKIKTSEDKLDRLILVGGISQRSKALNTDISIDRKIMEINYFGHIILTKGLLPLLLKSNDPRTGVISSISGKFGFHLRSAYSASKFALHGFFESLRLEHTDDKLKISMICPGRINTQISLSAITENGKAHGKMDPGQQGGMPADKCGRKIKKVIEKGKKDSLIGKSEILMVYLRKYIPFIFFRIANRIKDK